MIDAVTAEEDKYIDSNSALPFDFSKEFPELTQRFINEDDIEMTEDVSSAFDVFHDLFIKIDKFTEVIRWST